MKYHCHTLQVTQNWLSPAHPELQRLNTEHKRDRHLKEQTWRHFWVQCLVVLHLLELHLGPPEMLSRERSIGLAWPQICAPQTPAQAFSCLHAGKMFLLLDVNKNMYGYVWSLDQIPTWVWVWGASQSLPSECSSRSLSNERGSWHGERYISRTNVQTETTLAIVL